MYLKGLELQGFKSFADKISLDFSSGVTAIVGPNGSGKSNISDAVRWVLGEQSAKTLRGAKMEDVIFNGTQKRSPLGFAEVTLVLENKDHQLPIAFEEVAITRKVFASGESQYLINQSPCRLKDIHELFMDTGLGRDGYSMIGQGKIEEILSTKSEDRRQIFEEAAGISKYRYRKEEAERKLSRTEENIDRVADIILELKNQLEPLERQSQKAKTYLVLKEELKIYEVNAALSVITANKEQMAGLEEKLRTVSAHLEAMKQETEQAEKEQEDFYQTAKEKEGSVRENEQNLRDTQAQISMNKSEVEVLSNTIEGNLQLIKRIEAETKELENRILEGKAETAKAEESLRALLTEKEEKEQKIVELQRRNEEISAGAGEQNGAIETLKNAVVEALNVVSDNKIKLSNEEIIRQNLKNRKLAVESELEQRSTGENELQDKQNQLEKEYARKQQWIGSVEERLEKEKAEKETIAGKLAQMQKDMTQTKIQLNDKKSRLSMLKAMEQNYEGYQKSVKEIMRQHENGCLKSAKIYGPVSKLISSEPEYTLAVEAVLGAAMQNIVVGEENDAKMAIEHLKAAKCGRATFLPVSAVKGSELDVSKVKQEKGFLGLASDFVSYDRKYAGIAVHLLGRTVVMDQMDSAIQVSRKYKNTFRIVTLEGELFHAGGSISGGSMNRHASLMGREKEIRQLEEDAKVLEQEQARLTESASKLEKEQENIEFAILKSGDILRENKEIMIVIEQDMAHNQALIQDISTGKARLLEERNEIEDKICVSQKETERITSDIAEQEKIIEEQRTKINQLEQNFEKVMIQKQEIANQIIAITVEKSALEKDIDVMTDKISALQGSCAQDKTHVELRSSEIADIQNKNEQFAAEIETKRTGIASMQRQLEKFQEAIQDLLGEKSDFEEKSRAMQTRSKELRENVYQLTNDYNRLETKKVKLDVEQENALNRLWDEYELTFSDALSYQKEDLGSMIAVNKKIAELKGKIRELGNVNVDAIEEFKTVKERFEFLTAQRDDLEKAKMDLHALIEEMTKIMKEQFSEKFEQINRYFKTTFVELFGGGSAELALTDAQNILECGINIDVQPPGKKLQSLSLLSGGERALSAIALLFAILRTRPTPFCFLDEIEAALDDVNVYRFADYVKNYSKKTQFIIVTHRRGTMESADVIYGVTMQEKGVSKLLQLNLNEIAG